MQGNEEEKKMQSIYMKTYMIKRIFNEEKDNTKAFDDLDPKVLTSMLRIDRKSDSYKQILS